MNKPHDQSRLHFVSSLRWGFPLLVIGATVKSQSAIVKEDAMWIWFVVAVLAAIGEILTFDLFLASVAVAAVITAVLAIVFPVVLQVTIFAGLSLAGIAFVRPAVKHALGIESATQHTGLVSQNYLAGRRGVVTRPVDGAGGQIRIGEGEFWSARSFDPTITIPVGTLVEVVLVEGITALIEPVTPSALSIETDVASQKGT